MCSKYVILSSQHYFGGEDLLINDHIVSTRISTMKTNKLFICALRIMRTMAYIYDLELAII